MIRKYYFCFILFFTLSFFCVAQQMSFSHLYGASLEMNLQSVEATSDGGYILCGGVYGPNGGDFIVIKTDENGNEQWRFINNQFDGDFFENYAVKAKETPDKGFIVFGDITVSLANPFDLFVAKFDSAGTLKWKKQYNLDIGEFSNDFLINKDTSLVFVGRLQNKAFIMKTNFQGDTIWKRIILNDSTDNTSNIKIFNWNQSFYLPRLQSNSQNSNYGVLELLKFDTLGSLIWKQQFVDTARVWALGDFHLSNDSIILNLNTMNYGFNYFTQLNKFDLQGNRISSAKIKTGGKFINDSVCGGAYGAGDTLRFAKAFLVPDTLIPITKFYLYNFKSRSLITVGNNKVVACGSAENGFSGYFGFLAVAADTSAIGIKESIIENPHIKVFPNPASNEIYFDIENFLLFHGKNLILKIYDIQSKEILSKPIKTSRTRINTQSFKNGEFIYALFEGQKRIADGKIIIN